MYGWQEHGHSACTCTLNLQMSLEAPNLSIPPLLCSIALEVVKRITRLIERKHLNYEFLLLLLKILLKKLLLELTD